jgi:hypothetical protein
MFIQYDGNVGISTTSPIAKLDIQGQTPSINPLKIEGCSFRIETSCPSGWTSIGGNDGKYLCIECN